MSTETPHHAAPPYRSDIDGLRAFAVLSVVLYHFGIPLKGGFVGVDVFFVISGFLIGGILWREYAATGKLRLLPFYLRRFKRLAPAFFAMVLVTGALGWALLLPFEYRDFAKTVIAATVYLSNVLFYRSAGYFDTASEEKPLLHTWSLAVEEQFYIVLPILFLILARWRKGLLGTLVLIWLASLVASVLLTPSQPTATFYLFPFRAWELLSGVLLAIWGHETGRTWKGPALLSWAGLALLVVSVVAIPAGEHFPGLFALPPVVGAMLLLANGTGDNPVNRALSLKPVVFVGLISYSLYLWHWPVFTLSTYLRDGFGLLESLGWMALSVLLGWLSWKLVETPVRRANGLGPWAVLGGMTLASGLTLAASGWIFVQDGAPQRFGAEARVHIDGSGDFLQDWSRCFTAAEGPLAGIEQCPIGPEGDPQLLVWGDSHVRAFKEGIDLAAHEADVPGLILWRAGCPPLFGLHKSESAATPAQDRACDLANQQIAGALPELDSIRSVLLIGRWTYYATGQGVGLDAENTIAFSAIDSRQAGLSQPALLTLSAEGTSAHLQDWAGQVFVLRQPPEIPGYDSRRAAREAAHANWPLAAEPSIAASASQEALAPRDAQGRALWSGAIAAGFVTPIETWPRFCFDAECHAVVEGVGQYFDNNHITNRASLRVRDLFAPVLEAAQ